jgi:demethylmenaquinone methyltransferase/2-methoxy-6-polyprenyl-1,4-benzoquinol methylase
LLSDGAAYRYLPRSVAYLPPPERLTALLTDAGFRDVDLRPLTGGLTQLIVATR